MNVATRTKDVVLNPVKIHIAEEHTRAEIVKEIAKGTLTRQQKGICGPIAYWDEGATLYTNFIESHNGSEHLSASAKVIASQSSALAHQILDAKRLVIIGGGSSHSIENQEFEIVRQSFQRKEGSNLVEIVLIDASEEFLNQQIESTKELADSLGVAFNIAAIQGDFRSIAPNFDSIMTGTFGLKSKDEIKSAIMATGGTFRNFGDVKSTDGLPEYETDVQMARLSSFGGIGSTVIFDYFTELDQGINYYKTPELEKFFLNIPKTMVRYLSPPDSPTHLYGLNVDSINGESFFQYSPMNYPMARLTSHDLIVMKPQTPELVNGDRTILSLRAGQRLPLMASFRPELGFISSRPTQNTGLKSSLTIAQDGVAIEAFKILQKPSILSM